MNRSFCTSCGDLVPSRRVVRDGKVFLTKECPKCGVTEALVSNHAARHMGKRELDPGHDYEPCGETDCAACTHHRQPTYAFVDVTNRCNMNCPMCVDSVAGHGFPFEPPMEYFERILEHLSHLDPLPTIALFGGEPTVRKDLLDIIRLARSFGFNTRVLTNGIKLADEAYCKELAESHAHLLVSYDGNSPEQYERLRGSRKFYDHKVKAVENLGHLERGKISYVTCLAWGLNDDQLPELLAFYHSQRHILHGVYLMPLVATWTSEQFDYKPERMTTEDVEVLLAQCFPDYDVQFISLGLASDFPTILRYLGRKRMPYIGTHPNCESFYLLISDGETYVPVDHFLRKPLPQVAGALLRLERRLAAREKRWETSRLGRALGAVRLRGLLLRLLAWPRLLATVLQHVRVGRLFRGWGPAKLYHALMLPLRVLVGRAWRRARKRLKLYKLRKPPRSRVARERHTRVHDVLRVIVLPLEDDPIIETERLERCPSVHVTYHPATGEINYVPVCSWRLYNKQILRELADAYAERASAAGPPSA